MTRIIPDMAAVEYHAHPAASNSLLSQISRSPLHARAYLDGHREETDALSFGTALHVARLEPGRYATEYGIFDGDARTKEGKANRQAIIDAGKQVIYQKDHDLIVDMMTVLQASDTSQYIAGGLIESSVFWTDPATGMECKCRPDSWLQSDGIVVDLKSADDASPDGFARACAKYRYHVQAAHYMDGTKATRFIFIAQEKKPPYAVGVYELSPESLELGRQMRDQDLQTYASCMRSGVWPGYPSGVSVITLPSWSFHKTESEEIEVEYVK